MALKYTPRILSDLSNKLNLNSLGNLLDRYLLAVNERVER